MLNKILILFKKKYLLKFSKYFNKKVNINFNDYNFQNLIFEDIEKLKKIFFTEKYRDNCNLKNIDEDYHSFNFLVIGRILGGSKGINLSKKHIFYWNSLKNNKFSIIWSEKLITKRFINLVYNYDFFAISASKSEKNTIDRIILKHNALISLIIKDNKNNFYSIEILKAHILGSLILEKKTLDLKKIIANFLFNQIDKNGFHKSYSPLQHTKFINNLHEIKNIILFFNLEVPKEINFQIINMTSLLLSLLHKDRSIALFNGTNNKKIGEIIKIINLSKDIKSKKINNLKNGIAIFTNKNSKLFLDIVKPSNESLHDNIHASTLAFEFSHDSEKIITNCGSLEKRMGKKPEYLRLSAAHSSIIINNTNITELVEKKSFKRSPKNVTFSEKEDENCVVWEASHDGYLKNFNKVIKRKMNISKKENKIIGTDTILNTKIDTKTNTYSIRFHLMSNCNCILANNRKTVFIKTNKKQSWVFKSTSRIAIEDSINVFDGNKIKEAKQIVINGVIKDKNISENWSLIKS